MKKKLTGLLITGDYFYRFSIRGLGTAAVIFIIILYLSDKKEA